MSADSPTWMLHKPSGLRVKRIVEFYDGSTEVEFPNGARITLLPGVLELLAPEEAEADGS